MGYALGSERVARAFSTPWLKQHSSPAIPSQAAPSTPAHVLTQRVWRSRHLSTTPSLVRSGGSLRRPAKLIENGQQPYIDNVVMVSKTEDVNSRPIATAISTSIQAFSDLRRTSTSRLPV